MPSMGYHITPLPQSDTNWMGVGMNLGQALQTGRNNYDADQLAEANRQAGGLAAAGDLTGARNLMWSQGHPAEGTQWGNLAQAARGRQEEATKAALTQQVGALLAQGTPEARAQAAQTLYKAGRIAEAQALVSQGQNAQAADVTKQANQAAAAGDWVNAAKFAYQSGDTKAGAFFQEKAAEQQKAGVYQGIAKTQAIRSAAASAKSQADYDAMHDALAAAGYPAETVDKYRDFSKRDQHLMELDAHQKDLEGRLAPEDREKVAKAASAGSVRASLTPAEIGEGTKTGQLVAEMNKIDAPIEEWRQTRERLKDPLNLIAERDEAGHLLPDKTGKTKGALSDSEFNASIGPWSSGNTLMTVRQQSPFASERGIAMTKYLTKQFPVDYERMLNNMVPTKGASGEAEKERLTDMARTLATSTNRAEYDANVRSLTNATNIFVHGLLTQREQMRARAKELSGAARTSSGREQPLAAQPGAQPQPGSPTAVNPDDVAHDPRTGQEFHKINGEWVPQ